jgi:sterol desaturase/sphingolipid hydroxylase (fatty acid hydroxylase superfamily)
VAPNYIALAVPGFFLCIGIELAIARRRGRSVYRIADAFTDLGCGMTQQVLLVFCNALLLAGYAYLYGRYRLIDFSLRNLAMWLLAFLGIDLAYYWWHRLSHRVNFLWAGHVVHHSSEDYNLAVALRQSVLTPFTIWPFYAGLALLGVPPIVYAALQSFNLLYQFWIHTELIGKLGPLELFLNTPSLHRVHHAINPRYLDKNYGATLVIWDRWFGTYEPETEPPVYGLVKPLHSFNPAWAQVHYLVDLARFTVRAPMLADKLRLWWKGPTFCPAGLPELPGPHPVSPSTFQKYEAPVPARLRVYLVVHFFFAVAATFLAMLLGPRLPGTLLVALAAFVLLSLITTGALLERKRWARPLEVFRLVLIAAGIAAMLWM